MTQWQKFTKVTKEILKEYWIALFMCPLWIYDEFRAKLRPPFVIWFPLMFLSLFLSVALFPVNIVLVIVVVVLAAIAGIIDLLGIFRLKTWFKSINEKQS